MKKLGANYVEHFGIKVFWIFLLNFLIKELSGKILLMERVKNSVENCVGKVVCKIRLKNSVGKMCWKIIWNHRIYNCMEKFDDQFGWQLYVKFSWNKLCVKFVEIFLLKFFCWKFGVQLNWTFMLKMWCKKLGQKLAAKTRWNNWVEKLSDKSLKCTVFSKVVLISLLRESSLESGTFRQAPTLLHPSKGGGSNSPTRWSQLSDKVVLIVQQSLFCRTIETAF